ncbi:MAG TPA: response regulator [Kofleriaceae bacterium]|nr:response regulator [Kofleriaceae bacterium]
MTSILIVEDERVVAQDLAESLRRLGYDVCGSVASSDEALAQAEARQPDLVLMDVRIRGQRDGIETARILRRRHDTPVVYLTAFADEATVNRARDTEPYGYLIKPFRVPELRSAIEIALYKHDLDNRLRARERWISTILRSIADAVVAIDPGGVVTVINDAAEVLVGDAVGHRLADVLTLFDEPTGALVDDLGARALAEHRTVVASGRVVLRGNHGERPVEASATPILDDRGLLGAVVVLRDLTAQRRLQEQIVHHDRLRALGALAAGVAHEINNPLTYVLGGASFLGELTRHGHQLPPSAMDAIDEIIHGAWRVQRIVSDLGVFGRGEAEAAGPVDVLATVGWAIRVTAHELRPRAQVVTHLEPVPPVIGTDARLGQVMVNLLTNAAQAIAAAPAGDHRVTVTTAVDRDGDVVITVADTGIGIAPANRDRIFDPFFTTRPVGGGSGLGLSICHGIVAAMHGAITVDSMPGEGATFRVRLPAAPSASGSIWTQTDARRGRVLVVDDEPPVLARLEAILGGAHDVVAAGSGREALAIVDADRNFDVIVCDLGMPGLTGLDVYERIRSTYPELATQVIFLTDEHFSPRAHAIMESSLAAVIAKPIDADELLALVDARVPRGDA